MTAPLDRERLLRALRMMAIELAAMRRRGEILIAGGAVMILLHDVERTTRDVDGHILTGHGPVLDAAARVASQLRLPRGWLNEGMTAYLSTEPDPGQPLVFDHPNLTVTAVTSEHLFALKARAARAQDLGDLRVLAAALDLTSSGAASALVRRFFPDDPLSPRAQAVIDDLFDPS